MVKLHNRALLAPMSGITDLPFRRLAHRLGAGLVVAEMAAGRLLAAADEKTLKRIAGSAEISPHVIQIMGRDPGEMAGAAKLAVDLGADMIDINMGCPARKVTTGLAGSALMREPELALRIVAAVVAAVDMPVSLKMRLGWDRQSLNAPTIAREAEAAGVAMIFVHGRTRNQFYEGEADWAAIRPVVDGVKVPVFANGDINRLADVDTCLTRSGACGVMIGRGALGRPWFIGEVARHIEGKPASASPSMAERCTLVVGHYEDIMAHYGYEIGVRVARKHLGWYVDALSCRAAFARRWRELLLTEAAPKRVIQLLEQMFDSIGADRRLAS